MICPKYKLLFIHVPKTGGSSIAFGLFDCMNISYESYEKLPKDVQKKYYCTRKWKHASFLEHPEELRQEYSSFGICRDPLDRFYSQYTWWNHFTHRNVSYEKFADMIRNKEIPQHFSQKHLLEGVERIYSFHQLDRVFDYYDLKKTHRKKRKRALVEEEHVKDIVQELYSEDYEYFQFKDGIPQKNTVTL